MRFDRVDPGRIHQLSNIDRTSITGRVRPESSADHVHLDRLSLSDKAHDLRVALHAVQATPDVRPERLEQMAELRQQISNGTYRVPTEALVRDLLRGG